MSMYYRDCKPRPHPRHIWLTAAVFVVALAMRVYHLTSSPLWIDEIYTYQLGQSGLAGILRNSLFDPHPPLYYLIQWVAAGAGHFQHAAFWRWLPALSGAYTVALVYRLARATAAEWGALLSCGLFAVSPLHIFFSQEARSPAFVLLLTTITMLLLQKLHTAPQRAAFWVWYLNVALLGLYCSYNFVLVLGVQLGYLAVVERRWKQALLCGLVLAVCALPLVGPFLQTTGQVAQQHMTSRPASLIQVVQALLGGEPVRFGYTWGHTWLPVVAGWLALLGIWQGLRLPNRALTIYYLLQVALPLGLFFAVVSPLLGINLILLEAKQFMPVLPAFFVLVAQGIQVVWAAVRRSLLRLRTAGLACGLIYGATLLASFASLNACWTKPRSAEGLLVLAMQQRMQAGDVVISLHHWLGGAIDFYLPDVAPYTRPARIDDDYLFSHSLSVLRGRSVEEDQRYVASLKSLLAYPRIWLLFHRRTNAEFAQAIIERCTIGESLEYRPFKAVLLEHCAAAQQARSP